MKTIFVTWKIRTGNEIADSSIAVAEFSADIVSAADGFSAHFRKWWQGQKMHISLTEISMWIGWPLKSRCLLKLCGKR